MTNITTSGSNVIIEHYGSTYNIPKGLISTEVWEHNKTIIIYHTLNEEFNPIIRNNLDDVKINGVTLTIANYESILNTIKDNTPYRILTQAQYDALTSYEDILYIIIG